MNLNKITQENLYLILPEKTSIMAQMYARRYSVSILEALKRVYNSAVYQEMENKDTKLWLDDPAALFEDMMAE
jgi:hypothetical protein